jgi:hypothetical protein
MTGRKTSARSSWLNNTIYSNQTAIAVPPAPVIAAGFQSRRKMGKRGAWVEGLDMSISFQNESLNFSYPLSASIGT